MDGGSAYGIGNTMHVVGITTSASHTPAVVEVNTIYDNVGDVVRFTGVSSESYIKVTIPCIVLQFPQETTSNLMQHQHLQLDNTSSEGVGRINIRSILDI